METFNYILRRVGQMLIALFVSSIIVFFMIRLIPGNPAQNLLGDFADPDAVAAMEEKMGLNDPYIVQYGIFLRDLARLDLGDSLKYKTSVASLMGDRMVITVRRPAPACPPWRWGACWASAESCWSLEGSSMPPACMSSTP